MAKRSRTTSEVSEALTLSTAARTALSGYETKDVNGVDTKHFKSRTRHSGTQELSHRELLNIICPPFKVVREWYGNTVNNYSSGTAATVVPTRKYVTWTSPSQSWETFIHLPKSDTSSATYPLETLMYKARDISNWPTQVTTTPLDSGTQAGYEQQMNYHGGFVQHTFTNTGNTTLTFEFFVSTPRRPLAYTNLQYGTLPAQCAVQDKINSVPTRNTNAPIDVPAAYDSSTDKMFTFTKHDATLHYNWKVSGPKRCNLQPGQNVIFTVHLPSFKFTESAWNKMLGRITTPTFYNINPEFVPFATVILDVRVRAELCHSDDYVEVNIGSGAYTHVQKEYHHMRALPYAPTANTVMLNNLSTGDALQHRNPLTEAEDAFAL